MLVTKKNGPSFKDIAALITSTDFSKSIQKLIHMQKNSVRTFCNWYYDSNKNKIIIDLDNKGAERSYSDVMFFTSFSVRNSSKKMKKFSENPNEFIMQSLLKKQKKFLDSDSLDGTYAFNMIYNGLVPIYEGRFSTYSISDYMKLESSFSAFSKMSFDQYTLSFILQRKDIMTTLLEEVNHVCLNVIVGNVFRKDTLSEYNKGLLLTYFFIAVGVTELKEINELIDLWRKEVSNANEIINNSLFAYIDQEKSIVAANDKKIEEATPNVFAAIHYLRHIS